MWLKEFNGKLWALWQVSWFEEVKIYLLPEVPEAFWVEDVAECIVITPDLALSEI